MRTMYRGLCPNCGGDANDEELLTNGVCGRCVGFRASSKAEVYRSLLETGRLRNVKDVFELAMEMEEFSNLFRRLVGSEPWSLQETWMRRMLLGRSFSIIAPTGIGKTTFGIVAAIHLHQKKGLKSYLIFPSSLLVQHVYERFGEYLSKLGEGPRVTAYYTGVPKPKTLLDDIMFGEFDVLITTDRFLYSRFDTLRGKEFDLVFVDDVDSFLKSPRNIDKVVELLGYSPEVVETVLKKIRAKSLDENPENYRRSVGKKILIVSGATSRAKRTLRVKIFRQLFGFEPGHTFELVRNIGTYYLRLEKPAAMVAAELLEKFGGGALVFVPQTQGVEGAENLAEELRRRGIPCMAYQKFSPSMLEKFEKGEYEALIGVASSRNPLARGIDLPERIRYVAFAGVPRREIVIERAEYRPQMLLTVLKHVAPLLDEPVAAEAMRLMGSLSRVIPTSAEVVERVREAIATGTDLTGFEGHVQRLVKQARTLLDKIMTPEMVAAVSERADIRLSITSTGFSLVTPDVDGFIQASGRCSRLYAGGITRGVAIMLVDDEKSFYSFSKRLETIYDETMEPFDMEKVAEDFKRVDEDRRKVALARMGRLETARQDMMRNALVVVESPTKARTIATFFGRPVRRRINGLTAYESISGNALLTVVASGGHVFDLTTSGGYHGVLITDSKYIPVYTTVNRCMECGQQFVDSARCPYCGSEKVSSKLTVVEAVRQLALEANEVLVATDPDAEGEKIGYDIYCFVKPYNERVKRLEFHEITRKALAAALASPRDVKESLVEAQLLRRIEDRWVGFELSKKVQEIFGRKNLSAGRVQTPVLGWVVNRTEEAAKKIPALAITLADGLVFEFLNPAELDKMEELFNRGSLTCSVEVSSELRVVAPAPPYTTDSMLRDAWQYLRMGAAEAMAAAQTLFESGLITYHRTDSTTVSTTGLGVAKAYIEDKFPTFFKPRTYSREGAHECIRPTKPLDEKTLSYYISSNILRTVAKIGKRELALYGLIFRRFMASQMPEARVLYQRLTVKMLSNVLEVERPVEIVEEGFLRFNPVVTVQPRVEPGTRKVVAMQVRKVPAARLFTEGELIAMMKSRGIGRPSTYAKIIQTLYERNYIFQNAGRIISTKLGKAVYRYLSNTFGEFVSEDLTRKLERVMDEVEEGQKDYIEVLRELYGSLKTFTALTK